MHSTPEKKPTWRDTHAADPKLSLADRVTCAARHVSCATHTVNGFREGTPEGARAREIVERCVAELFAEAERIEHAGRAPRGLRLIRGGAR